MYCSSCGVTVVHGLTYCNHCGAKLVGKQADAAKRSDSSIDSLIWAIVSLFVGGIGVLIGLLAMMKNLLDFNQGLLMFFSLLTFGLLTAIEAVFIWMLFSRTRPARGPGLDHHRATKELEAASPRMLADPTPLTSVTEHTTRSFDPVYEKRK
ncbi:MAG TPA: hypothetical protein VF251_13525 [Pyrinomonadaceae bacterium]